MAVNLPKDVGIFPYEVLSAHPTVKLTWQDHMPHTEILQKTNCQSIEAIIMLGHVIRMEANHPTRKVLYGQLQVNKRDHRGDIWGLHSLAATLSPTSANGRGQENRTPLF